MKHALLTAHGPRGNDPHSASSYREADEELATVAGFAQRDVALLVFRVTRIDLAEWIR